MNGKKRIIALLLCLLLVAGVFTACGSKEDKTFEKPEDFAHARIGVLTGSSQERIVKEKFPEAERVYFSRPADMVIAVEQGKIDGYMFGSPFLVTAIWENANIKRLEEAISQGDIAFAFPKDSSGDPLRKQLNDFLAQSKEDGTLAQLERKWLGNTEPTEHPDYMSLTGENGTIRLAAVAENKPLIYQYQNQCTGYEMELLTLFAKQYGYRFEVEVVPFDSVIMGMATGKYDMTSASLQVTAERAESVNFSDPYMQFDVVLVVKDDGTKEAEMTLADLENATIGIITGSSHNGLVEKNFPNAKRVSFNVMADMNLAVQQGKIDCYIEDSPFMAPLRWEGVPVKSANEPVAQTNNGFVFPQREESTALRQQVNAFLAEAKADGTIERLLEKWLGDTEPTEHPDYMSLTGENGTIRLAISVDNKPLLYQNAEGYTGFEMELLTYFGQYAGYAFDIEVVPFESVIAGISSGRYDMGASTLNITPEREESVDFSDPYATFDVVMVIKDDGKQGQSASENGNHGNGTQQIKTLEDAAKGTLAILTGSIWDGVAQKELPNAERKHFSAIADMILALEQGKVDAILGDETFYINAKWENVPLAMLDERVGFISCGMILAKDTYNEVLLEQLNAFIAKSKTDGTLDALCKKWLSDTEPAEHPDYAHLSGENGVLKIALENAARPMTYRKNDVFTGFDVDLLTKFAEEYGYGLEFTGMSFDALIPTVSGEKCDIGVCGIAITQERAESVTFTDSYAEIDGVVVVREQTEHTVKNAFLESVSESFEKTFIREDRWKLIVDGIGVTVLISLSSAAAGSLLGFGLYMLSRSDVKLLRALAKGIAKVYARIIAGTPVVVILMILFYVVFGKIRDMSGIVVAIMAFTLIFGAFVYEHMTVSVDSVDPGQTEAAYALGYTKRKTFFRILFPQAMTIFLPSYCGHAVELIKATAVVGYVAVNDLTKMGDIIRSNTYEAFFPLISTAVIYFLLTWLLSLLLGQVKARFEPKRRSNEDVLKGIKTERS